jgi:RNA polymerase sigma-70 factor (sigma-E family)
MAVVRQPDSGIVACAGAGPEPASHGSWCQGGQPFAFARSSDARVGREARVREPAGFAEFVAARSPALLRAAWLLTGDGAAAQDLVQAALIRTWSRWAALERVENAESYVRRVMATTYVTWWRRRWRAEVSTGVLPDRPTAGDAFAVADLRDAVRSALDELPRRQRAVIVLRYFEDLTEAQTAAALGCSVGTVKSQTAKALARLRRHDWLDTGSSEGAKT